MNFTASQRGITQNRRTIRWFALEQALKIIYSNSPAMDRETFC